MSIREVAGIGGVLLVAFILNVVSVFTDGWITYSVKVLNVKSSTSIGIVPYHSSSAAWFGVASWMMFVALALFFVLILFYLYSGFRVYNQGCSHEIRHFFHGVGGLCIFIAILQVVAFIIIAAKASSYAAGAYASSSSSVGYSGYLALGSSIFLIVAAALSGHVSYHCH